MNRTKVFATPEELEEIKKMHKTATETPMILIGGLGDGSG